MKAIFKASEWKDYNDNWHVADVSDLANNSAAWWIPARILGLSLEDFILMLMNEYHANIKYLRKSGIVLYTWKNYNDAHQFLLYINRVARNKNWTF